MRIPKAVLIVLALSLSVCTTAQAAEPGLLRAGFAARDEEGARQALSGAREPLTRDLILWSMARRGQGAFDELAPLAAAHPDWPAASAVRRAAERAMPPDLSPGRVRRFFAAAAPKTLTGAMRLAAAGGGEDALRRGWATLRGKLSEQEAFIAAHPRLARAGAAARLDQMLWRGDRRLAEGLLGLVDPGRRALGAARLGLQARVRRVDDLVRAVPAALADDPGLAHDRFVWRRRKGLDAEAAQLVQAHSRSAASLGRPEKWADPRERLARSLFASGQTRSAYRVASQHHLRSGSGFAALEWLSGWIALRGMNDPKRATGHFIRHWNAVETPISKGRGGYWTGRAFDAAGDAARARMWYEKAAAHPTSFYGQLAADRLDQDLTSALRADAPPARWRDRPETTGELARAAQALAQAGRPVEARLFGVAAGKPLRDKSAVAAMGAMAVAMDRPDIAIRLSKDAVRRGILEMSSYFPTYPPLSAGGLAVESALAHAISRTESELNPRAVSHAGARGLMQLMPRTAQKMARDLGTRYDSEALTSDPGYNARLGAGYLRQMLDRWDGARILAAASYNAGPHRAQQWVARFGDPRTSRVDAIDWIESIPFNETRNYVQRVMEAYHVYRARLGQPRAATYRAALTGR